MTKGRKAVTTTKPALPQVNEVVVREDLAAVDTLATLNAATLEGMDLGEAIGVMGMGLYLRCIADSAVLSAFTRAKKSKAWANLTGCDGRTFSSFDEFCKAKFGHSYRRLAEITANRNSIGEEAFDQAQRLGLRQIDYNMLKALPAPKREIIRQAIAEGSSRDDLVAAIQELAANDQQEIAQLGADLKEAQERIAAKDKVAEKTQKTIQRLQEEIAGRPAPSPEFVAEKALRDLDTEALACAARIETSLRAQIVAVLDADSGVNTALAYQGIAAAIGRTLAAVRALADDVGVALTGPNALPEAHDSGAEDEAVWDAVNRDMGAKNERLN